MKPKTKTKKNLRKLASIDKCSTKDEQPTSPSKETEDLSLLTKPIDTSITNLRQISKLFDNGSDEIKSLLDYECHIIYECKVCQSLYRSLANFLSHKRVYCKTQFNITFDKDAIKHSSMNNYEMVDENQGSVVDQETKENYKIERVTRSSSTKEVCKKDLSKVVEMLQQKHKEDDELNRKPIRIMADTEQVLLEKLDSSNIAYQSVLSPEKRPETIDLMKAQATELATILERDTAVLGPDGQLLEINSLKNINKPPPLFPIIIDNKKPRKSSSPTTTSPTTINNNLTCTICGSKFATKKTLTFHIKSLHTSNRMVYPCPLCLNSFTNPWGAYRHLFKIHKKSNEQVRKMRSQILAKAHQSESTRAQEMERVYETEKLNNSLTNGDTKVNETEEWMAQLESDSSFQQCGGCGKRFDRKAALLSHSQICQKRIAACTDASVRAKRQKLSPTTTTTNGEKSSMTNGEKLSTTNEEKLTTTSGEKSTTTSGEKSTTTNGEKSTTTSGEKSTTTNGEKSTTTSGEKSTTTNGEKSTTTSGEKSTTTNGEKSTTRKLPSLLRESIINTNNSISVKDMIDSILSPKVQDEKSNNNDEFKNLPDITNLSSSVTITRLVKEPVGAENDGAIGGEGSEDSWSKIGGNNRRSQKFNDVKDELAIISLKKDVKEEVTLLVPASSIDDKVKAVVGDDPEIVYTKIEKGTAKSSPAVTGSKKRKLRGNAVTNGLSKRVKGSAPQVEKQVKKQKKRVEKDDKKIKQLDTKENKEEKEAEATDDEEDLPASPRVTAIERIIGSIADKKQLHCIPCGKSFSSMVHLRRHIVIHINWNRYHCKICDFKCFDKGDSVVHCNKSHNAKNDPSVIDDMIEELEPDQDVPEPLKGSLENQDEEKVEEEEKDGEKVEEEENDREKIEEEEKDGENVKEEEKECNKIINNNDTETANQSKSSKNGETNTYKGSDDEHDLFSDSAEQHSDIMKLSKSANLYEDPEIRRMVLEVIFGSTEDTGMTDDCQGKTNPSNESQDQVDSPKASNEQEDKINSSASSSDEEESNDKKNSSASFDESEDKKNSSTSSEEDQEDKKNSSTSSDESEDKKNSSTSSDEFEDTKKLSKSFDGKNKSCNNRSNTASPFSDNKKINNNSPIVNNKKNSDSRKSSESLKNNDDRSARPTRNRAKVINKDFIYDLDAVLSTDKVKNKLLPNTNLTNNKSSSQKKNHNDNSMDVDCDDENKSRDLNGKL